MSNHICRVDCQVVISTHSVTGEEYRSHVMYASEPSSAAGRYQWELNRDLLDAGRRAWRASGQGSSRAVRIWDENRRVQYEQFGDLFPNGRRAERGWAAIQGLLRNGTWKIPA